MKVNIAELKECAEEEMATATYQLLCDLEAELRSLLKESPRLRTSHMVIETILGDK